VNGSEYDLWADYYDIIHTGIPGEAEFYVGQAVRLGGQTLELGCGTGRICIPMAMSGVDVVGLDNSKAMLAHCRRKKRLVGKTPGRLELVHGDMRGFGLKREFDLVAMPYRTFMHLLTAEDQQACLNHVHRHLRSGGTFILNLWVGNSLRLPKTFTKGKRPAVLERRYALPGKQTELAHFVTAWYEPEHQIIHEKHILHEVKGKNEVIRTTAIPMRRAWLTPEQMRQLLIVAGFRIEAVFGDFDCGSLTDESTEMIWIARK